MSLFIAYRMTRPCGEEIETGIVNISTKPLTKPEDVAHALAVKSLHFMARGTMPVVSWALVHGDAVAALIASARLS